MSAAKRIPNRLKFSAVMSDLSKLEGTLKCSDEQWESILEILLGKPSAEPAGAEPEEEPLCSRCDGSGSVSTGITESPTTLCNKCDGTGLAQPQAKGATSERPD